MNHFYILKLALMAASITCSSQAGFGQRAPLQPVTAQQRKVEVNRFINMLLETLDPDERRDLRRDIAQIKPAPIVLTALLQRYESADETLKNQIESIIGQMDFSHDAKRVFDISAKIKNVDLLVCVTYALGNSTSPDARRLVLELLQENSLLKDDKSTNIIYAAVYRIFLDNFDPATDGPWLVDRWDEAALSAEQQTIGIAAALKHSSTHSLPLLQRAIRVASTDAERADIANTIARIEEVQKTSPRQR